MTSTTKAVVIDLIQSLPEDVSLDEILSLLQFRQKVDEGLGQLQRGDVLTHEQVRSQVSKWIGKRNP